MATVAQILRYARQKLDDLKEPYLWSDEELLIALQTAYDEFCEKTEIIRDSSTASICEIPLLSNQSLYSIDQRVLKINSARLSSGIPLQMKSELWMDDYIYNWRERKGSPAYLIPDYEIGRILISPYYDETFEVKGVLSFDSATKTISKSTGGLSVYQAGDRIYVSGTTSNNGYFTVVTVSNTALTVSESLTDELNVSGTIKKVMETLYLTVNRLGVESFSLSTAETTIPEINSRWHYKLVDGILREAYSKQDSETYDPNSMQRHATLFMLTIEEAKRSLKKLRHYTRVFAPHGGTI